MNTVHIGNYGVKDEDVESGSVKISGLIGRNSGRTIFPQDGPGFTEPIPEGKQDRNPSKEWIPVRS